MADKHHLIVAAQREFIGSIADRVASGAPFNRHAERSLIAGILRAWARQIPDTVSATRGAEEVNPGHVAIHFACLVNGQGQERAAAIQQLAEIYEMPAAEVTKAIDKFEAYAMRLVPKKA